MFRQLPSAFLYTLISCANAAMKHDLPRPDPFADPRHDPYNPLKYIASNTLTGIAVGMFLELFFVACHLRLTFFHSFLRSTLSALILAVGLLQTWLIVKTGARWMMSMTIGIYCGFTASN